MTMTTTTSFAPKIQKIIDAAKTNGWAVEIVEDTTNYISFEVIHPNPGEYALGKIHFSFFLADTSWRFDGATKYVSTRDGGTRKDESIAMRNAIAIIEGAYAPRQQAVKALDEAARVKRRENAEAAYAAEQDGPERRQLRANLVHMRDTKDAENKLAQETRDSGLEWATGRWLQDALVERHLARMASQVLHWEGTADQQGTSVTTLEEAIVKTADGAVAFLLSHMTRGLSGSSGLFVNVWKDVEALAKAKFIEQFHPLYGGYAAKRLLEDAFDPKWVGNNGF